MQVLLHDDQEPAQRDAQAVAAQGARLVEARGSLLLLMRLTAALFHSQYDPIVRQHVIFNETKIKKG